MDESLTDAEYDRLDAIMCGFPGEGAMNLEEMDGFFAALICSPVVVVPGVYLPEIWGSENAPFDDADGVKEFFNLAMRRWNVIARELQSHDAIFVPWLGVEEPEELPRGNRWAQGFLRGIGLCREDWEEIFSDDDKFAMLLSVMALAHENDPDPEMRSWEAPPSPELREQVLTGLAISAQRLYDYFQSHRTRETRRQPVADSPVEKKIGRNEPCYCGSGKR